MASDFWLVVGLGNPGKNYENTRHNIGFMVIDLLAQRWNTSFKDHKGLTLLGKSTVNMVSSSHQCFFMKPTTFMNNSGAAVSSVSHYYQIQPEHIIVVHDDMDLELGRIKIKQAGSSGGHNGIKSIDRSLGSTQYYRVRVGIGRNASSRDKRNATIDWVLGNFSSVEQKICDDSTEKAADAVESIMSQGLVRTQERFHSR